MPPTPEPAVTRDMEGKVPGSLVDRVIGWFAERQLGVVARAQLLAAGIGEGAIEHRLRTGRLLPVFRGVYSVGHRLLSREARWMATVLSGGRGAVLSFRTAAALWRMRAYSGVPDVTTAREIRNRKGVRFHTASLPADETTVRWGIPVTTVHRTLLDIASVLSPDDVDRAMHEAVVKRLTDPLALPELIDRYPGRRGVGVLRSIAADRRLGESVTRSELEKRFLQVVAKAGLPRPEVNSPVEAGGRRFECDCVWRGPKVVVELDGHVSHDNPDAFERDRGRDRRLQAVGWRVIRVTWRALHQDRAAVVADLRPLISPPAG